jgi:hypothetical protein
MKTCRAARLLLLTAALMVFNVSCANTPKPSECEKRVIVHFLQPVTNEQGLEIVQEVLMPIVKKGLQVSFRIQVNSHTVAYSLSAPGCVLVEQGIEALRQAQLTKIRLLEMDLPVRIQK